jgi:hypothetical protein
MVRRDKLAAMGGGGTAWCRTSLPVCKWQHEGDLGENSFCKLRSAACIDERWRSPL